MAKETAHLTGCGPADDKPLSKREKLKARQENYDKLGFSKFLCGDEAIVTIMENDNKAVVELAKGEVIT